MGFAKHSFIHGHEIATDSGEKNENENENV
jgi:hypothetical protein